MSINETSAKTAFKDLDIVDRDLNVVDTLIDLIGYAVPLAECLTEK